jgi:hypothetical protein
MSRISSAAVSLLFIAAVSFADITGEHAISTPVYASTAVSGQIASNGDGYFEVWLALNDRSAVYGSAVTANGVVRNPSGILLSKTSSVVALLWTGDSYLVVWNEANDVAGQQFDSDGRSLNPAKVIVPNAQIGRQRALATNGRTTILAAAGRYFVLDRDLKVVDSGTGAGQAVYSTSSGEFVIADGMTMRLDSAGRYVPRVGRYWPNPIACRSTGCVTAFQEANTQGHLAVAPYDPETLKVGTPMELPLQLPATEPWFDLVATGDGYVLVTGGGIVQRLDPDGNPAGSPVTLPAGAGQVSAASNGRDVAVVRAGSGSLLNSIITSNSVTQFVVGISANAQRDVHIARSHSNYLAVWTEKDGTYAGRLSLDGAPLDGRGVLLTSDVRIPSVIFEAGAYLVVVSSPGGSDVIRIDPVTGLVVSRVAIKGTGLKIGSDGFSLAGVWIDTTGDLLAAFLYPNGALASAPVTIASPAAGLALGNPSLAWNGTIWLVTWPEEEYSIIPEIREPIPVGVRAARLSVALVPLDSQPIAITTPAVGFTIANECLSSDGRDFLVAWTEPTPVERKLGIRVRRVLASGALDPETQVVTGTMRDLIWDGAAYDVAFSTGGSGVPGDVAMVRLRATGQPIETMVISATDDDRSASLVPIPDGRILAAYTRVAFEEPYDGVERAFVASPRHARERATR